MTSSQEVSPDEQELLYIFGSRLSTRKQPDVKELIQSIPSQCDDAQGQKDLALLAFEIIR
jgi:hypothetical protein